MVNFSPPSKCWIFFWSERVSYCWYVTFILLKNSVLMSLYRLHRGVLPCILLLAALTWSVFSGLPGFSVTAGLNGQFVVICVVTQSQVINVFLSFCLLTLPRQSTTLYCLFHVNNITLSFCCCCCCCFRIQWLVFLFSAGRPSQQVGWEDSSPSLFFGNTVHGNGTMSTVAFLTTK